MTKDLAKVVRCMQCSYLKPKAKFSKTEVGRPRVCNQCRKANPDWKPTNGVQMEDSINEEIYQILLAAQKNQPDAYKTVGAQICQTCSVAKLNSEFAKSAVWKSKMSAVCRDCALKLKAHKDDVLRMREIEALEELEAANWWVENKERVDQWIKEYSLEFVLDQLRKQGRQRIAAQVQATPAWANPKKIAVLYAEAYRLTRETGEPYHVDHVVPLQGPMVKIGPFKGERLVYGLHWEGNMQVLRGVENSSKGNRWWPDMPEEAIPKSLKRAA